MTFQYTDISLQEYPGEVSLVIYNPNCSLRCPWCFNPDLIDKKPLSYKQMKDAINEHLDFITAVTFSGGEPLNNKLTYKIVDYCKSNGLKTKFNTNGLIAPDYRYGNWGMYIDYLNISLKGPEIYQKVPKPLEWSHLRGSILEYSFVYSPSIWSKFYLKKYTAFLKKKIAKSWHEVFYDKWTKPDIFTIQQFKSDSCLNNDFNICKVPSFDECLDVIKMFKCVNADKYIISTQEFGRRNVTKQI